MKISRKFATYLDILVVKGTNFFANSTVLVAISSPDTDSGIGAYLIIFVILLHFATYTESFEMNSIHLLQLVGKFMYSFSIGNRLLLVISLLNFFLC